MIVQTWAFNGPNGSRVTLERGACVEWDCPAGIAIRGLTGRILAIDIEPGSEYGVCVGVDLDPNDELAASADIIGFKRARWTPDPHVGVWYGAPRGSDGLSGRGGLVVLTREGVEQAIASGQLRVATLGAEHKAIRMALARSRKETARLLGELARVRALIDGDDGDGAS